MVSQNSKLKLALQTLTLFHLVTFQAQMELEMVHAFADGLQTPFAMAVLDNHQVNSVEELDQAGKHLATQAEHLASTDADSLDSILVVLANFYHLLRRNIFN